MSEVLWSLAFYAGGIVTGLGACFYMGVYRHTRWKERALHAEAELHRRDGGWR